MMSSPSGRLHARAFANHPYDMSESTLNWIDVDQNHIMKWIDSDWFDQNQFKVAKE